MKERKEIMDIVKELQTLTKERELDYKEDKPIQITDHHQGILIEVLRDRQFHTQVLLNGSDILLDLMFGYIVVDKEEKRAVLYGGKDNMLMDFAIKERGENTKPPEVDNSIN